MNLILLHTPWLPHSGLVQDLREQIGHNGTRETVKCLSVFERHPILPRKREVTDVDRAIRRMPLDITAISPQNCCLRSRCCLTDPGCDEHTVHGQAPEGETADQATSLEVCEALCPLLRHAGPTSDTCHWLSLPSDVWDTSSLIGTNSYISRSHTWRVTAAPRPPWLGTPVVMPVSAAEDGKSPGPKFQGKGDQDPPGIRSAPVVPELSQPPHFR